jgi:hypothetical protein
LCNARSNVMWQNRGINRRRYVSCMVRPRPFRRYSLLSAFSSRVTAETQNIDTVAQIPTADLHSHSRFQLQACLHSHSRFQLQACTHILDSNCRPALTF